MPRVTVRYWAAAKHAAGVAEEKLDAATLAEALAEAVTLAEGAVIEVLPPFAGG